MSWTGCPDQRFGPHTYAQHGDDLALANIFELIGVPRPGYLDIGAHHPRTISNTALLYDRGSRGVNVEANPVLIEEFRRERPEDINLSVGIGPTRGKFRFHFVDERSGLNSFSPEELAEHNIKAARHEMIEVVTINDVVNEHCGGRFPELLLLDAEGWDHEILASAQFGQSRPMVICAEIRPHRAQQTKDLLANWDYVPVIRVMANLIFARSHIREKLV